MSALGQKRTCAAQKGMSALPPKADIEGVECDIRFVPIADIGLLGLYVCFGGKADIARTCRSNRDGRRKQCRSDFGGRLKLQRGPDDRLSLHMC